MTASFSTFSFPQPSQRPISFVHYNGPKKTRKPTPVRITGDNGVVDNFSVESAETCPSREALEPTGPVSEEPPTVAVDDECLETYDVNEQDEIERSAAYEIRPERRVSTNAGQVATSQCMQDNWKQRWSMSSVLRRSASRQRSRSVRSVESDDAELDYLFNSPIETQDPASPIGSSRSSPRRSSSEGDPDLVLPDDNSPHISTPWLRKRGRCSYPDQSGDPLSLRLSISETSMPVNTLEECIRQCEQDRMLDRSGSTFFTPMKRSRQRKKSKNGVGSLAGVFIPGKQLRNRNTKITPPKISNLRTPRRDLHSQLPLRVPRGTQDSNNTSHLDGLKPPSIEAENHAQEQFGCGASGRPISQASSTSASSSSPGPAHVQSVLAACQSGQPGTRDICVQSISPELSFLIFTVPDVMSLKALICPQDDLGSAADLGYCGGLENIIVKQIQPAMWLVAGTVRSSEVSCVDLKQKDELMYPSNEETDSAYGNISDDDSNSPGEQFLEKNQRWSPEDDRMLREWVENGRPWSWVIRQFPMRTPGSVRTRYSMLRRKPT